MKPGLYQVRVAATDRKGGPVGSVWDWIEIPDFSAKKLALSSLLVGERKPNAAPAKAEPGRHENRSDVRSGAAQRLTPVCFVVVPQIHDDCL